LEQVNGKDDEIKTEKKIEGEENKVEKKKEVEEVKTEKKKEDVKTLA
jgi:hypothetical protein